jgi:hypothetical protein
VAAVFVGRAEAGVTMAIALLIAVEILNVTRMAIGSEVFAAVGVIAVVSVVAIEAIINVSPEVPVTVEPWTRANEDAAGEPFGSVVAIRGTFIRRVIKITIGTDWWRPDLHRNLRVHLLRRSRET